MGTYSKRDSSFILQAGVLAMAGIIVKIIGMLYRSPLTAIIGDEGNGYYSFAYNIYANILLISSYSIPSAISKVMAQKLAFKEYKNAHRIFRCALVYVTVVGAFASLFAFFAAPVLVVSNAVTVLRIFAPTIFLSGFLGVLRGYFQAQGSMVQTSISQIIEQILNAVVSISAAYGFIRMSSATGNPTARAVYGASGSALGTGCGVLAALLFMFFMYMINKDTILSKAERDDHEKINSYREISRTIFLVVTPFILSTFIYNCTTAVNQKVYSDIMMGVHDLTQESAATLYGIFSGKAVLLRNVPVAMASAMSSAIIPNVTAAWSVKKKKEARRKVAQAVKTTMIVAMPCSVGMAVLANPIIRLLFPQKSSIDTAAMLLCTLSVTIIFYCISTITNGVLQSTGQINKPVTHAAVALVVQAVVLALLLRFTKLGLYSLVIADIVYSLMMCLMNGYSLKKHMKYRQEVRNSFVKPALCSLVMGMFAFLFYQLIDLLTGIFIIAMLIAIAVAVLVYFVLILLSGAVSEKEILGFPKGYRLVHYGKKLRLIR